MIGEEQAVWRNKRTRSTVVKSDGSAFEVPQKIVRDGESVGLLDLILGEVIKQPHAFIGGHQN
jgi:hypothetical protein